MSSELDLLFGNQKKVQSLPSTTSIEIPKHQVLISHDTDDFYSIIFKNISLEKNQIYDLDLDYSNEDEDFKWFASGQANLSNFKGQYIAIWKKQIIGASNSVEAERIAKATWGENINPLVTYIPEDEITVPE